MVSYGVNPAIKRLIASMLKGGIAKFLVKKDFEYICLELNLDIIWNDAKDLVRLERNTVVLIPGYKGDAESAFVLFLDRLFSKEKGKFLTFIDRTISEFSSKMDHSLDLAEIRNRLEDLRFDKNHIDKMQIFSITQAKGKRREPTQSELGRVYDSIKLHPLIVEHSETLFKSGHYASAIFEAFKAVNNYVKQKSCKIEFDGKDLMAKVFNKNRPVLKLNDLATISDKDEQEGFMFLFMGAMEGIRNPKAHETVAQKDPYRTLEYLAFASLLAKRVDESKK
jgi:uncharacterized protein (TIGR02391 family)